VVTAFTDSYPFFSKIEDILPDSGFRLYHEKIARQTIRFSGRTAINAQVSVSEPAPPEDADSPLAFSMEGYRGIPPSSVLPYYWAPGWNSVQAVNTYLVEPDGAVKGESRDVLLFSGKTGDRVDYFKEGKA
jgi:NADH-quinone oxidoreductase subunit G